MSDLRDMKGFMLALAEEAGQLAKRRIRGAAVHCKGSKNIFTDADIEIEKMVLARIAEKYPAHLVVSEETETEPPGAGAVKPKTGGYGTGPGYTWYIDPVDGTSNYAHGDPNYCVSIALAQGSEVVTACIAIPAYNQTFYAEKGAGCELNGNRVGVSTTAALKDSMIQLGISPLKNTIDPSLRLMRHFMLNADRARDYGACALQLALVASGRAEGFIKFSQHAWDIAAGILLVEEAGGKVSDEKGSRIELDTSRGRTYNIVASNSHIHQTLLSELGKLKMDYKQRWY